MDTYSAEILWKREGQNFLGNRYSRKHVIKFDGGAQLAGSSSPQVVPVPQSDPAGVDPEEMFVAAISSCHMLWFLAIAAKRRYEVDQYADAAVGIMERNEKGKLAISTVTLKPSVQFSGTHLPSREEIDAMHQIAHEECFIANSVNCAVRIETVYLE
jgi:organic hydroperoxide reductase OsmC/OhrA